LIIYFPNPCIDFYKKIAVAKVTQKEAAVAVANKIFIVACLEVDELCCAKSKISPAIKIINAF